MLDLRTQFERCLQGSVCFLGLGNVDYGDDGFGVRLAEDLAVRLRDVPGIEVVVAGASPERFTSNLQQRFKQVIFLDAVEFGGTPGSIVLLTSAEMAARFPQISTHKISLGLLAKCIESNSETKVWLLGVEPDALRPGQPLTPRVKSTLEILRDLLVQFCARQTPAAGLCGDGVGNRFEFLPGGNRPPSREGLL